MLKTYIVIAALLGDLAAASNASTPIPSLVPSYSPRTRSSGIVACDALKDAGLEDRILFATDAGYESQIATWWAVNGRLRPSCLVLPQNTHEVSTALKALVNANDGAGDWHIAVRSGGHSSTGCNNIISGVTIDLSNMNSSTYDSETNIAKIQPGGRWKDVYADLNALGVTVVGGRDGGVGVGGFTLGGGISFFSNRMGFACDTVVNFEVVLANGTIVNANSTYNADLWSALKGGSSNFGIVTRFDKVAIPAADIYYDLRMLSFNYSDTVVDAIVGFTNQNQSLADDALFVFYTHNSSIGAGVYIMTVHVNTVGDGNTTTAMDQVKRLPVLYSNTVLENMADAALNSQLPAGTSNAGYTLTFRNDPEIIRHCVEFHTEYVASLSQSLGPDAFTADLIFQPIPSYMAAVSQQRGGNMLGLNAINYNAIMWTVGVSVNDNAALAVAQAELSVITAKVKELSRSMKGDIDLVYINYADSSQDPLGSYGAKNVQHMREVAAKYDPAGVFQKRIPGGFKISRVA